MHSISKISVLGLLLLCGSLAQAQSRSNLLTQGADPRGPQELTICSQNLGNYGLLASVAEREANASAEGLSVKERALAERFTSKSCDVIAVQEILGREERDSLAAMERLAYILRQFSNRFYDFKIGASNDPTSRVGYLVAKDKAEILNLFSYNNLQLPKLTEKQKPRSFGRGPLELQIQVKPQGESAAKIVNLINFHFKSKRGGGRDAAELQFETYRMEMAEALRRIVESRHSAAMTRGETILVMLGDRNSHFDTASAKILEGVLTLRSFQGKAPCRMSDRGLPLCQAGAAQPQKFFSVLVGDPQTKQMPGTFEFKKEVSWLDEILMPAESLRYAWAQYDSSGDYDSGVVSEPKGASDHAMVWVNLNW